jgi:uncharacterized protein
MKLTHQEKRHWHHLLSGTADTPVAQQMHRFVQHGQVSTFQHCADVSRMCFWLNRRLHLGADERTLVRGAFLHDFYLYDWHDKDPAHRLHGFRHAQRALENAQRHFALNHKEREMIRCHMWPLNLRSLPRSREAAILCLSDKICALHETLFQRHGKQHPGKR